MSCGMESMAEKTPEEIPGSRPAPLVGYIVFSSAILFFLWTKNPSK